MPQFQFTNNAVKDLSDIWIYTVETWSESQADKYYKLIINACSAIAKEPQIGKVYPEIYSGLKGKLISKHIIFYRVREDESIEITRILHERMDVNNKLKNELHLPRSKQDGAKTNARERIPPTQNGKRPESQFLGNSKSGNGNRATKIYRIRLLLTQDNLTSHTFS
jgi:toxin ParE1/3/4